MVLVAVLLVSPRFTAGQQSAVPPAANAPPQANAPQSGASWISLDDAIRLALQHNHALQALRSTIQQSLAEETTANLRPNPTLGLDAQYLPIFQPNQFSSNYIDQQAQFDAGVGYLFERGKKRQHRLKATTLNNAGAGPSGPYGLQARNRRKSAKMRVLFISAANDAGSMTPLPLGLACVAGAAESAGHDVRLLTVSTDADCENDIRQAIQQSPPDIIGLSVRNIDDQNMQSPRFLLESLKRVVTICRAHSSLPIVLGGAGYSIFPESALAYLGADYGVRGEGEAAFPALLSWHERGRQSSPPPATYFANGSHTPSEYASGLDGFPLPQPRLWLDFPESTAMRIPVQSRRGCPLDCIYCSTSLIEGKPVRERSPESLVAWLSALRQKGFRHFYFVDNTFNLPSSYAKELCRKLIEADLGLDWWAIVYPKWVDLELVKLMAKAGCTQVSLGFESGSDTMLPQLNKQFTSAEVGAISEAFRMAGIQRNGFLLLGGPGETKETVEESLEFADRLHLDMLKVTVGIRIYPQTPLVLTAVAQGLITADDNLLVPRFYITPSLRHWLPERIARLESGHA